MSDIEVGESFHALVMMYPNGEKLDLESPQSQEMEISFIISLFMVKGHN